MQDELIRCCAFSLWIIRLAARDGDEVEVVVEVVVVIVVVAVQSLSELVASWKVREEREGARSTQIFFSSAALYLDRPFS